TNHILLQYYLSLTSHTIPIIYTLFFLPLPPPPTSTLFPYTTLFRSLYANGGMMVNAAGPHTNIAETYEGVFKAGFNHNEITVDRSEEHTSELQSRFDLVCRLLLEKKKKK